MMKHFQVVVHAGTAEAYGAPFFQGAVDFDGLLPENRFGAEWIVVMVQAVDADFEAAVRQVSAQYGGDGVITRNKIEGGAETEALFHLRELHAIFEAVRNFDVVGKDEGEFLSIRPVGDLGIWLGNMGTRCRIMSPYSSIFQGFGGIGIDGPDICIRSPFPPDKITPEPDLQPPGDEEFEGVVRFV
jgi:hypothetical protein